MRIYIDIILVALLAVYIVDVSGFTETWRAWLADALGVKRLRPLPPFDCGKCATWWACVIYAAASGRFGLGTLAASALLSLLSIPLGQMMIFIREGALCLIDRLFAICDRRR